MKPGKRRSSSLRQSLITILLCYLILTDGKGLNGYGSRRLVSLSDRPFMAAAIVSQLYCAMSGFSSSTTEDKLLTFGPTEGRIRAQDMNVKPWQCSMAEGLDVHLRIWNPSQRWPASKTSLKILTKSGCLKLRGCTKAQCPCFGVQSTRSGRTLQSKLSEPCPVSPEDCACMMCSIDLVVQEGSLHIILLP